MPRVSNTGAGVLIAAGIAMVGAMVALMPLRRSLLPEPLHEGVYVSAEEIGGFTGTVLELREGRYRHWFYSDVGSHDSSRPREGSYRLEQGKLYAGRSWSVGNAGPLALLWRDDALRVWREAGRIYDYGILIRVDREIPEYAFEIERPSIRVVYEALGRPFAEWKDPFVYGPQ